MTNFATLFLALLCVASADEGEKNRPVSKVITVLKDMVTQLEKEDGEDEETYETFGCWCQTNDKEKTKSIADGEEAIKELTAAIEGFTATSARLTSEIADLEKEVAKNTQALDTATALRNKEATEFKAEEKETLQTIATLKSAVVTLSKHHEASLVQGTLTATAFMQNAQDGVLLRDTIKKNQDIISELFTPRQRKMLNTFVQNSQEGLAPASGEIFGILKQMQETFEGNLAMSQKEEAKNQMEFEALKKSKEAEITAGNDQISKKSQQETTSSIKNVEAKSSLEDTQNILDADMKFLANLKVRCGNMDADYEERTQTRHLEIQACTKALEYLSSDEAHDLFTRSFNFVQVSMNKAFHQQTKRDKIVRLLAHAAHKAEDPQLSMLAVKVRKDAFTKVKESIQGMMDNLIKEKEDETKHKAYCIVEIAQNEADTEAKTVEKNDLEVIIADLTATIDQLSKEIEALKAEVAELQVQLKRAGENRESSNKEFQIAIADQRATQKLLKTALDILKGFYEKKSLVETRVKAGQGAKAAQEPPPTFKSYEKNHQSGGVMGMLTSIINDAKAVENEAIRGEEDAQKMYEGNVIDTNLSIEQKVRKIVNKSEMKAKTEGEKVEKENEHKSVLGELEALDEENADLHKECDFTIKNFDVRRLARDDEIEALKHSLDMLGGGAFVQFLETYEPPPETRDPDDDKLNDMIVSSMDQQPMSYSEWADAQDDATGYTA